MAKYSDILLAVDFDRTLTDEFGQIPQRNLNAIRTFQENGGVFTVATGRSIPMFRPFFAQIPANAPLILYNGAAFYDVARAQLSEAVPIPNSGALLRALYADFPQLTLEIQGIDAHEIFRDDPVRDAFYRNNGCPFRKITFETLPPSPVKLALYTRFRDTTVKSFFSVAPEEAAQIAAAQDYLAHEFGDTVEGVCAAPGILDIQARGVDKGSAARRLAKRLHRRVLVCVGDALNDVSMLDEADFAFVPQDCVEALRNSRYPKVCACGDGSVADAIERLG